MRMSNDEANPSERESDFEAQPYHGSALHAAAMREDAASHGLCKLLLEAGADPNARDRQLSNSDTAVPAQHQSEFHLLAIHCMDLCC